MRTINYIITIFAILIIKAKSETIKLWHNENAGPGAENVTLTIHLPKKMPNETPAVIICPGGGYGTCVMTYEGNEVGEWFSKKGIAAFVLKYRVSPYRHPLPKNDVLGAIKYVREKSNLYNINSSQVGVMGFSAGGHLAATAATQFTKISNRPNFLVLAYPVLSMKKGVTHEGSKRNLLGINPDPILVSKMSLETQVNQATPPTFIFHTYEDQAVPAENALLFVSALNKFKIPCEFHLFQKGRHGVGLGTKGNKKWSTLLHDWLIRSGYIPE